MSAKQSGNGIYFLVVFFFRHVLPFLIAHVKLPTVISKSKHKRKMGKLYYLDRQDVH